MKIHSRLGYCVLVCLCVFIPSVNSHETVDEHTCSKPVRPGEVSSMMEREVFYAQLAIFEQCIFDYIRGQQRQAELHEQAARSALDEWASYIQPFQ